MLSLPTARARRRAHLLHAALPVILLIPACGSPAAPAADPATPAAAADSREAPPADAPSGSSTASAASKPAPGAGAASPSSGGAPEPAPAASSAAPEAPLEPAPVPFSAEERKEFEKKCTPLQKAMTKIGGRDPEEALAEVLKKPPKMPAAELERCTVLLTRSVKLYVAAAVEVEATVTMTRIVKSMVAAYSRKKELCPSSARPVPADLARLRAEPFTSTATDWEGPAWACLGFSMEGQSQRFQYEVKSDPNTKKFQVIARGYPIRGGAAVEISQEGSVTAKGIEVAPPVRK